MLARSLQYFFVLIVLPSVMLFGSCANKDPKGFAEKVFMMVQQGDSLGVMDAVITKEEFNEVIIKSKDSFIKEMITKKYYETINSKYARNHMAGNYAKVLNYAKQEQINLKDVEIDNISYQGLETEYIEEMTFVVYFHSNNKKYEFGSSCLYTSSGWKLIGRFYMKGYGDWGLN